MLAIVKALPKPAVAELVALMWFGRSGGCFKAYQAEALDRQDDEGFPIYFCAKGPLADYLDRAMRELKISPKLP